MYSQWKVFNKIQRKWRFAAFLLIILSIRSGHRGAANHFDYTDALPPDTPNMQESFENIHEWLWTHPPTISNYAERQERMRIIQMMSNQISASTYMKYLRSWRSSPTLADRLEQEYGTLSYLRSATQHAIQNLRETQVKQGAVIWYFYNMGYVVKTPTSCFGIDLHFRDAHMLTDDLDFLLVTHGHRDHYTSALLDAMLAANKPVITRWYPGSRLVTHTEDFKIGTVRVKVDIGDHHRHLPLISWNNMLMFQIDCGTPEHPITIYHCGDGNRFRKMRPDKPVDVFIVHVQLSMDVTDAIQYINPRFTLVSHVLELSHDTHLPLPLRWSFDFAFKKLRAADKNTAIVLTWGERWIAPETVFETQDIPMASQYTE
jgi:hypothetical protein